MTKKEKARMENLERALQALATRTLDYVGDVDDERLECDQEMRKLARAALALTSGMRG